MIQEQAAAYLTLMDTILISTFVITALIIAFNVYLKRLETVERENLGDTIDKRAIWLYPLSYFVLYAALFLSFSQA